MPPPRKNGTIDYRETRELLDRQRQDTDAALARITAHIESIDVNGSQGLRVLQERVAVNAAAIPQLVKDVESLKLTRAEGKGRTAVIAVIVSALVTLALGLLIPRLQEAAPPNDIGPIILPTPTVVITVTPAAAAGTDPTFRQAGAARPPQPPSPQPSRPTVSPTPTLTPTGPPGLLRRACRVLERFILCPAALEAGSPPRAESRGLLVGLPAFAFLVIRRSRPARKRSV